MNGRIVLMAAVLSAAVACGGSKNNPLAPDTGGPGPSGATITLTAAGSLSPVTVTVAVGQSVSFVNASTRPFQIDSNPHPEHGDCPAINAVNFIQPGQTKLTNAFSKTAVCGFHDHNDPENANLKGTITIQ